MSKRPKKTSSAKAAIEAALQIALEEAMRRQNSSTATTNDKVVGK